MCLNLVYLIFKTVGKMRYLKYLFFEKEKKNHVYFINGGGVHRIEHCMLIVKHNTFYLSCV